MPHEGHARLLAILSLLGIFMSTGCTRRETAEEYNREAKALAETVAGIHEANLRILMRKVPPELILSPATGLQDPGGSIQDLHESSESCLEKYEGDNREIEEQIKEWEEKIAEYRDKPNPFATMIEASVRYWELDRELKRIKYRKWKRE